LNPSVIEILKFVVNRGRATSICARHTPAAVALQPFIPL